jgi:uncharacterized protein (TIGR03435 family)
MSEKLFRLLLRLYPPRFRDSYGDEALQLFRDRLRDESGPSAALRLWFDLVCDFIVTVPGQYLRPRAALHVEMLQESSNGAPSLFVLGDAPPSTKSLLSGTILSILALTLLSFSQAHSRIVRHESRPALNEPASHSTLSQRGNSLLHQSGDKKRIETAATKTRAVDVTEPQHFVEAVVANMKKHYADLTKQRGDVAHRSNLEAAYRAEPLALQPSTETPGQSGPFTRIEVEPARSTDPQSSRVRVLPNGNLIATSVNAITLISEGYGVPANPSDRLSTLPPWVYSERYDIEAEASPNAKRMSPSDIFRRVLADRFHLVLRTENKSMSAYALVVAQGGSKLKQAAPSDCVFDTAPEGCHTFVIGFGHPLNARAVDMDDLARYIENWTDLPVVNKTSLAGLFTVSTEGWRPMRLPPPPPNGAGNVDFTHLQTVETVLGNLGLKLQKKAAPLPVYTVLEIQRP